MLKCQIVEARMKISIMLLNSEICLDDWMESMMIIYIGMTESYVLD